VTKVLDRVDFKTIRQFFFQELHDCKSQMTDLTNKWYQAIRVTPPDEQSDLEIDNLSTPSTSVIFDSSSRSGGKI
jgi:hypothetical protein